MVGSHTLDIRTIEDFSLEYDVPPAPVGTIYYLETSGLDSIDYYEDNYIVPGERLPIYTYYSEETNEDGTRDIIAEAAMTAHMRTQDPINIYVDGVKVELSSPAIFDGFVNTRAFVRGLRGDRRVGLHILAGTTTALRPT